MTDRLYNEIEISKIEPDFHIKLYLLILNLAAFYFVCTFQIFTVVSTLSCPIVQASVLTSIPYRRACVAKVWRSAWNGTCLQPACSRICDNFFLHAHGSRGRSCSLLYGDGNSHFDRTFLRYSFSISISGNGRMIVR